MIIPLEKLTSDFSFIEENTKNAEPIHLTVDGYGKYVLITDEEYEDLLHYATSDVLSELLATIENFGIQNQTKSLLHLLKSAVALLEEDLNAKLNI